MQIASKVFLSVFFIEMHCSSKPRHSVWSQHEVFPVFSFAINLHKHWHRHGHLCYKHQNLFLNLGWGLKQQPLPPHTLDPNQSLYSLQMSVCALVSNQASPLLGDKLFCQTGHQSDVLTLTDAAHGTADGISQNQRTIQKMIHAPVSCTGVQQSHGYWQECMLKRKQTSMEKKGAHTPAPPLPYHTVQ